MSVESLESKLISSWHMNELSGVLVADSFGLNDGTAIGATINTVDPLVGAANRFFTRFNQEINISGYKGERFGSSARGFSAFIRSSSVFNNTIVSYGRNGGPINQSFVFNTEGNILALRIQGAFIRYVAAGVNDGNKHHVGVSVPDGAALNDLEFYLDGVLLTSIASSLNPANILNTVSSEDFTIGALPSASSLDFAGDIDAVHWFDDELTAAEMFEMYDNEYELPVAISAAGRRRRMLSKG